MLKEISIVPYKTAVQSLIKSFEDIHSNMHRELTTGIQTLWSLGHQRLVLLEKVKDVSIIKRTLRTTAKDLILAANTNEQD